MELSKNVYFHKCFAFNTIKMTAKRKASFSRKNGSFRPSSQFKKALRKLNSMRNNKVKCKLIQNSSDDFIRDLAFAIHKCLPIYKPLLSTDSLNSIRKFSNPRSSDMKRRNLVQRGGGGFLNMLNDIGNSIYNVLNSPLGKVVAGAAVLL